MCAIRTGLDWSGDAGNPRTPGSSKRLVIALPQIDERELPALDHAFAELRRQLQFDRRHVFSNHNAHPEVRKAFLEMTARLPLRIWVTIAEKENWYVPRAAPLTPQARLSAAIVDALTRLPDETLAHQILFIDLPVEEIKVINQLK